MIEKLVTSKTRIKILKLFLSHIDDRYYLRELERMLNESLSPLRRQLVKLTNMEILIVEEEANLKYYRLNKNFEGLEELKRMVLEDKVREQIEKAPVHPIDGQVPAYRVDTSSAEAMDAAPKRFRYDLAVLSFISIFVLGTAIFVVYTNAKNIKQVASMISKEAVLDSSATKDGETRLIPQGYVRGSNNIVNNGEMISRKWKVIPGNVPVFSDGGTSEEKKSEEL